MPRFIAVVIVFVVIVLSVAGPLCAQTTRPAEAPWPTLIRQFADALSTGHRSTARELLAGAKVRRFEAPGDEPCDRLLARTMSATLVSAHGYFHPPMSMAADLAADLKAATVVPEEIRKQMIPEDDDQMKRANATAVQWTAEVLQAAKDQPVAVIVLWCDDRGAPGVAPAAATPPELLFILIQGEPSGKDQFAIRQLVYGDPLVRK